MTLIGTAKNRFRELFFPLLLLFTLLDWVILLEGKQILGITFNVNLSDAGMLACLALYVALYRKVIIAAIPRRAAVLCVGGAFLAVTFIGGLIANPYWMISLKYWIKIHVFFSVLVVLFSTTRLSRGTVYGFFGVIAFLNLTAIIEQFWFLEKWMLKFLVIFRTQEALEGSEAVSSVFVNQNIFGVLNALFLITLIALYLNYRNLFNKVVLFLTIALCAVGIVLSASRNAMFTTLVGLFFLFVPVLKRGRGLKNFLTILTVVVVLSILFVVSIKEIPYNARRFGSVFPVISKLLKDEPVTREDFRIEHTQAMSARISVWKLGIEKSLERPIWGWGNCMAYFNLKPTTGLDHLHNNFIEILYGNGILGLALLLALIALWLARLRSAWYWAPVAATLFMSLFESFIVIETWVLFTAWLVAVTTKDLAGDSYSNTRL